MRRNVVGYLKWMDFLSEVQRERPQMARVQIYHRTEGRRPPLLVRFWAEAAFVSRNEIHVARFPLGTAYDFDLRDPDTQERFAALMEQAEALLHAALAPCGVEVRRGVYAGTDRLRIRTDPAGLWRWEKDGESIRLVPEIPMAEAPA